MANYFNNTFLAALGFPTRISFDKFCDDYVDEARKLNLILKKGTDAMLQQCRLIVTPIKERIQQTEKERKDRAKDEKLKLLLEKKKITEEQHQKELALARKQAVEEYKRKSEPIVISSPVVFKPRPKPASPPPSGSVSCTNCTHKNQEIANLKNSLTKRDLEISELKETIAELEEEKLLLEQDLETFKEGFEDFSNALKRKRIQ